MNFHLCKSDKETLKYTSKPNYNRSVVFEKDKLIGIHLHKNKVKLNKPIAIGQTLLDDSKIIMYKFFYEYLKPKYGEKVRMCYQDTDCYILEIETESIEEDFKDDLDLFDTSNYPEDSILYSPDNKKVPGKMADEMPNDIIYEFIGLRPKMYSLITLANLNATRAKGIKKNVKKNITHDMYKKCLYENKKYTHSFNIIKSNNHVMRIEKIEKKSLSSFDTKKWICNNNVDTLAYGYFKNQM